MRPLILNRIGTADGSQPVETLKMLQKHRLRVRVLMAVVFTIMLIDASPRSVSGQSPMTTFSLGPAGTDYLGNSSTLMLAVYLNNTGNNAASGVTISSIGINGAQLLTPLPLLGQINAGGSAILDANFSGTFTPGDAYELSVSGTYGINLAFTAQTRIALPPAAPGAASARKGAVLSRVVTGGKFKPIKMPMNFNEANELSSWVVPNGPFVAVTPSNVTGRVGNANGSGTGAQSAGPADPSVTFLANDSEHLPSGGFNGQASTVAEPSGGANTGGVIFSTANWLAAYSTNSGGSFKTVNPTTIFPNDAVGYCCDQIVQYVPKIDRFIWLLQGNGVRIASASPAAVKSSKATAWTYWNLTPQFFGLSRSASLDYPHLSVGANDLYMSIDEVGVGLLVARIPLSQIKAGGTINVPYTDPTLSPQAYAGTVTQNTLTEVYWAGHNSTSNMRIFSWADSSGNYSWQDIGIGSWSNSNLSSTTPDGMNWMTKLAGFPGTGVIGATRSGNNLWFAWSAGTDNNFNDPHVEMVELDQSFNLLQQVQIWSPDYSYAYPALATNACTGEIGFSLEGGGDGNFENHLVGFWGDFSAYTITASNLGTTRFGDYVTIRQDPGHSGAFFDAFGYGLDTVKGLKGPQTDVHYVLFGRGNGKSCGG